MLILKPDNMVSTIKENLSQKCVLDLGNAPCYMVKKSAPGSKRYQSSLEKVFCWCQLVVENTGFCLLKRTYFTLTYFAHSSQSSRMPAITLHPVHALYFYYNCLYNSLHISLPSLKGGHYSLVHSIDN